MRVGLIVGLTVFVAGLVWFLMGSSGRTVIPPTVCKDCNILLIVMDPLRKDALGSLGNARAATPVLDGLANGSYLFENAVTVAPWTLPSAMSLMTGVYPSTHGITNKDIVRGDGSRSMVPASLAKASPWLRTLAEELKAAGYATGGFAGGSALSMSYGFDKGFDVYESGEGFMGISDVSPKAIEFVRNHKQNKLFVMLHGFDVHGQYVPQGGYDKRYVSLLYDGKLTGTAEEQKKIREEGVMLGRTFLRPEDRDFLRAIYDEKVARMDAAVGEFLAAYAKEVPLNKTIIIFTSNHGDEFYEHGRIDHGMTLFDEVIRIPLFIRVPGNTQGKRMSSQVRNIDIAPTVFSLIGRKYSDGFGTQLQGTSLAPLISGKKMSLDAFPETAYRYATFQKSIRTADGWKLIMDEETQDKRLYQVGKDKTEQQDVYGKSGAVETKLLQLLLAHIGELTKRSAPKN